MSARISKRTIETLRSSLPAFETHRSSIISEMASSLTAADAARGERRALPVATALVDMLIGEGRRLVSSAAPGDAGAIRDELERHGVERFHQSRFGDALAAVMVDVAGTALPRTVGGAWGDIFWAAIRRIEAADDSREAELLTEAA